MHLGIVDVSFLNHSKTGFSSDYHVPIYPFEWDKSCLGDIVVFTHSSLLKIKEPQYAGKRKYAWLIEPIESIPSFYEFVKKNQPRFEGVITHEPEYFGLEDKPVPFAGSWIYIKDQKVYYKDKLCSIVASGKRALLGHALRHEFIKRVRFYGWDVDIMGHGYNPIDYKLAALKNYKFHVVFENTRSDNWFTEKIIDCFNTGTIPIYWGCPNIGEYFDTDGIIQFETMEELENIMQTINSGDTSHPYFNIDKKILLKNLISARYYACTENQIYNRMKNVS